MSKRHRDATLIADGACNPSGIARSLVEACDECRAEGADVRTDPAVYLIVSQLAYLCGVWDGVSDTPRSYGEALAECCARFPAKVEAAGAAGGRG